MVALRALFRAVILLSLLTSSIHATTVTITLRCVNSPNCSVFGVFAIQTAGTNSRDVRIENGTARAVVDSDFDLDLKSADYWMPRQHLAVAESQEVLVWRTTVLRGRVSVQRLEEMPKALSLELQSPPGTKGSLLPAGSSVSCPVAADGTWMCRVPAVALDLVAHGKTFVPIYLWDLHLKPDNAIDTGTLTLKHGASFVAWLETKTARSLKQPATARLVRMTMTNSPTLGARMNQPVAVGTFNQRGMVQLAPIPAGTYTLEVTAPGFAPAQFDKVPVYEARETALRFPITLGEPLTIRFSIQPAHDPSGAPWRVEVVRKDALTFRHTPVADAMPADGTIEVPGQPPGRYTVRVRDHTDNWYVNREFDIQTASDAQHTVDINLIHLHGKLRVGEHPVAAQLFFGGRSGAQRVATTSDDDGKFAVGLPRAGKWAIEIESASVATAINRTIAADQDDLEIALPDNELAGWVTGLDSKRVADATVICYTADGITSRQTSADGTFRFGGVSTGGARLTASDSRTGERSRIVDVPTPDGAHREGIELRLENNQAVKGNVLGQGEPIVGARVTAYEFDGPLARSERAVTNLDGSFELRPGESVSRMTLIVAAAGRPLHAFTASPSDKTITLELAPVGGELNLRFPRDATRPAVIFNGISIPLSDLLEWARAQGSAFSDYAVRVPNVAPGQYAVCAMVGSKNTCKDGRLAPSGVLTLNADEH